MGLAAKKIIFEKMMPKAGRQARGFPLSPVTPFRHL
jgi:hypothetical protein